MIKLIFCYIGYKIRLFPAVQKQIWRKLGNPAKRMVGKLSRPFFYWSVQWKKTQKLLNAAESNTPPEEPLVPTGFKFRKELSEKIHRDWEYLREVGPARRRVRAFFLYLKKVHEAYEFNRFISLHSAQKNYTKPKKRNKKKRNKCFPKQ